MSVSAVTDKKMPLGAWLREQREARSWSRREQARRLIQAGREAGDTAMPGITSVYHNIERWERGPGGPSDRYKLYYCKVLGVTAADFGGRATWTDPLSALGTDQLSPAGTEPLSPTGTVNAAGLSVSFRYASGRLVIEIDGLDTGEAETKAEAEPAQALSLVTSEDPPRSYGGRV